jgi:hypothetical protein
MDDISCAYGENMSDTVIIAEKIKLLVLCVPITTSLVVLIPLKFMLCTPTFPIVQFGHLVLFSIP